MQEEIRDRPIGRNPFIHSFIHSFGVLVIMSAIPEQRAIKKSDFDRLRLYLTYN